MAEYARKDMSQMEYGKVIYYGAGDEGRKLFPYIQKRNQIIAWLDQRSEELHGLPFPVSHPDILSSFSADDYDYILIAVYREDAFLRVKDELEVKYSIDSKKIRWLHKEWIDFMREEKRKAIGIKALQALLGTAHCDVANEGIDSGKRQNRVKVRAICWGTPHLWNVMKTVCIAFEKDRDCDFQILLRESAQSLIYKMIKEDIASVVCYSEYDIEVDRPDIILFSPFASADRDWIEKNLRYCSLLIQIPIGLVRTFPTVEDHVAGIMHNLDCGVHFSIYDKLQYKELRDWGITDPRIVELGNPKFDNIYNLINSDLPAPSEWDKIKDKRTILWTTDHVWAYGNITFDLYFEYMIEYFKEHREMALIFRPHPHYITELLEEGIWSKEDLMYLKESFARSENMIFDEYPDYSLTYRQADGILCDVNCGIILSALPLGKPLGVTLRYDEFREEAFYSELADKLYQINGKDSLYAFLDMVARGEDPRRADREQAVSECVSHFDGRNGERIKEFVLKEYFKKTGENR